jgi:hypothetical protein
VVKPRVSGKVKKSVNTVSVLEYMLKHKSIEEIKSKNIKTENNNNTII